MNKRLLPGVKISEVGYFLLPLKGFCSSFLSIGETSVIAVGDGNLLRQKKSKPVRGFPLLSFPGCVLFGIIPLALRSDSVCLSPFASLSSVSLHSTRSWSNWQIITVTTWRS